MDFFFYGTLMDPDVLALVLGRTVPISRRQDASINGFRRLYRRGARYPVLVRGVSSDRVEGIVVTGLSAKDTARLVAFEGWEYDLQKRDVDVVGGLSHRVCVFMPVRGVPVSRDPWCLETWLKRHKRDYVDAIHARHRRTAAFDASEGSRP